MKNIRKKVISTLAAAAMLVSSVSVSVPLNLFAESVDDELTVTISMEGLTLGQGMYFEPETYTLSEINELVASKGYGPFDESNINAGMATLAFFIDNGIDHEITGSWGNSSAIVGASAYLSEVYGIDKGYLNIPDVIWENGFEYDETDANSDEGLGEFDYSCMSGWMITVNDLLIPVGMSSWNLKQDYDGYNDYGNDYVIRWQFTLWGYGADLGRDMGGYSAPPYFTPANKDLLYKKYAELLADGTLDANANLKSQVLSVMENLTASQAEVDDALALLENIGDINTVLDDTLEKLANKVTEPAFGTTGGEWTVLALARGDYFDKDSDYFNGYYDRIVETVNSTAPKYNGALHRVKYTENSRLIMALSAIGKDAHSVGDWDIIAPLEDFDSVVWQGINGAIFALIAIDTQDYQMNDPTIRQQYIDKLLELEISTGGWALSGSSADPDITAMTLQALSRYTDDENVAAAVERGINTLSSIQQENGGYASWGSINSESIAQVITACTALGIDPGTDERFVKNGNSAVDALLEFYDKDSNNGFTFRHTLDGTGNAMATDQASYALVSYRRFLNNQNSLYNMTDVELDTAPVKFSGASISLSGNIGVNFYMTLDESVINDKNAYMQFELPNGEVSRVYVSDAKETVVDNTTYYVFSCEVAAKEMADSINAQMFSGSGSAIGSTYDYSVEEYADELVNGDYTSEAKELVEAMISYGDYAEAYFSGKNSAATSAMNKVTENVLSAYEIKEDGDLPEGIEYYGSSLVLESNTSVRHYFKAAKGAKTDSYAFSEKDGYYYKEITDIPAGKLDEVQNVTIGDYTISYSPMSYAYAVLKSDSADESLKNLVKALYLYEQAADEYKNLLS